MMGVCPPDRRIVLVGLAGVAALGGLCGRASAASPGGSFVALGDWGRDGKRRQKQVAAAMAEAARQAGSRFVVSVGDNFYPAGVDSIHDPQWRSSFEDIYVQPSLQTPWYAALGNHDHRGDPDAQVAYGRLGRRWRMPDRHYSATGEQTGLSGLDLFVLDTTPMLPMHGEPLAQALRGRFPASDTERQLEWLNQALRSSKAAWKVVVGHHPIHTGGRHGEPAILVEQLKPLLEAHGVQVYLSGHDHVLQHIRRGAVDYVVTGGGASSGEVEAVRGTQFRAGREGFALFSLAPEGLTLEFRDFRGRALYRRALTRERA